MSKITTSFSMNRLCLFSFLFLCSLFMPDNAFSRQHWKEEHTKITYDSTENSITIGFEVYDYKYGPLNEDGYLRWCDFFYTINNGKTYNHLMRVETNDQGFAGWTWLKMRYKKPGAKLQLIGSVRPESDSMWPEDGLDLNVDVNNAFFDLYGRTVFQDKAFFTVKWFLGEAYKELSRIRINGFWRVNGVYKGDDINNVYYDIPGKTMLKSSILKDTSSELKSEISTLVKVTKVSDAILVTGAEIGENIKVYNALGAEVKSIATNSDVVNIKLAKNQIYIVKVGKSCYKVAL